MPSKGKKASKSTPNDRSPLSRTPSSASTSPQESFSEGSNGEELRLRNLLSAASSKYPNFISNSAVCGRIIETESEWSHSKGNQARVWLSESAMVSASLLPGSLVSVSLAASGKMSEFALDSLVDECSKHFGFECGDDMLNEVGSYFAIAAVFPSRKVLKNGVKFSWGLSCTMGFPPTGRAVFVSPMGNFSTSRHPNRTDSINHVNPYKCKDLYLNLVPLKTKQFAFARGLSTNCSSTELVCAPLGNGTATSPKTPSNKSKLPSPCATPVQSRQFSDCISSPNSSAFLDLSVVRSALADEKANELLQASAARWLYGRHLLKGNFVTLPLICGQICVFRIEGADKLSTACCGQDLRCEGKQDCLPLEIQVSDSLEQMDLGLQVDINTKVHLSDPMFLVGESPSKAELPVGNVTCKTIKEASDVPRLGGLTKEFASLKEIIMFSLANKDHLPRYKGVLLHGPPGTGKTSLASACARDAGARLFAINAPEIVSQYYGESEKALHELFDSAKQAAPAVVFIDELDAIAPARKDGGEELSLRMVATLLKLMDEINRDDGILVIAATNRPDSIDPAMRRPGRLDREIEIGVPSPEQRLDILCTLLNEMDHSLSNRELQSLASATHGFVGADLAALCNEAAMTALRRHIQFNSSGRHLKTSCAGKDDANMQFSESPKDEDGLTVDPIDLLSLSLSDLAVSSSPLSSVGCQSVPENVNTPGRFCRTNREEQEMLTKVTAEDFEKAKMKVRPSAMREVMLELPKVRWEDVGGQKKVKKQLIEAVQWPQMCPDAFRRIGIRPPRGLLMIGPPGCSKTLMARAVASEAKLNFLAVKGPELFSKWVGESEKAVKSLFAKARANSPAIIFFDEIDGLAIARGQENDGTSVADRVLSQLLVEMDGLDQRVGITVIAATNRPDKIDPALLRPGRFDRLLAVQPPNETDREDIFRIHMRDIPCSSDVNTKELACLTEGYTGADIKLICREAAIAALEENLNISEVSMQHFKLGIGRVHPSDVQFYEELASQFQRIVDSGSMKDGG